MGETYRANNGCPAHPMSVIGVNPYAAFCATMGRPFIPNSGQGDYVGRNPRAWAHFSQLARPPEEGVELAGALLDWLAPAVRSESDGLSRARRGHFIPPNFLLVWIS